MEWVGVASGRTAHLGVRGHSMRILLLQVTALLAPVVRLRETIAWEAVGRGQARAALSPCSSSGAYGVEVSSGTMSAIPTQSLHPAETDGWFVALHQ